MRLGFVIGLPIWGVFVGHWFGGLKHFVGCWSLCGVSTGLVVVGLTFVSDYFSLRFYGFKVGYLRSGCFVILFM